MIVKASKEEREVNKEHCVDFYKNLALILYILSPMGGLVSNLVMVSTWSMQISTNLSNYRDHCKKNIFNPVGLTDYSHYQ